MKGLRNYFPEQLKIIKTALRIIFKFTQKIDFGLLVCDSKYFDAVYGDESLRQGKVMLKHGIFKY